MVVQCTKRSPGGAVFASLPLLHEPQISLNASRTAIYAKANLETDSPEYEARKNMKWMLSFGHVHMCIKFLIT